MNTNAIEVIRHSLAAANAALNLLEPTRFVEETVQSTEVVGERVCEPVQSTEVVWERVCEPVQPTEVVGERMCEPVQPTVNVNADDALFNALINEFDQSEFNLRTFAELFTKLNITRSKIIELLDDRDVCYVTKLRRSDSAQLIGLQSRN